MTGTWATGWATGDIVTAAEFKKSSGSIFDTTLGGSVASVDVTGIVGTYAHLLIALYLRSDTAATITSSLIRFNGDTGANYDFQALTGQAAVASAAETFASTSIQIGNMAANTAGANLFGMQQLLIPNYANSTNNKQIVALSTNKIGTATTNMTAILNGGSWRSNAAINRITFFAGAGNLVAGSRVTIYGMGA